MVEAKPHYTEVWNLSDIQHLTYPNEVHNEDGYVYIGRGDGGDIDKHDRYKQRVKACSIFLQALQENPSIDDQRIFHGEKVDASKYIREDDNQ